MPALMHCALERAADRFGDRAAVRAGEASWSFRELDRLSDAFARHLAASGVGPRQRVAVMTTNRVEFVVAVHGISKAGAASVLLSPAWKAVEVDHALALTEPVHAVADGTAVALLASARLPVTDLDDRATDESLDLARRPVVTEALTALDPTGPHVPPDRTDGSISLGWAGRSAAVGVEADTSFGHDPTVRSDVVADETDGWVAPDRTGGSVAVVDETDESVLVFSSGTTGLPKAVRHTHRSIRHGTRHWCDALGLGPDDRFQIATPPSHILGLLNLLAAVEVGATVRLHQRFDLDEVLRRIETERMTLEMAVAPIALAMANHPSIEAYDLSSLRFIMWGATPVTESVAAVVTERTGARWLPGYGASELPVITCNPVDEPERWRLDSAGLPPAGVELRVVDLETGEVLPPGEVGEIQVLSPSAMAGYLPDDATADAFADGWYRTGDVGWLEADGWVHLTDRSKEMMKVNGFQVAPAEIEGVLLGHPAVLDCAVFPLPDERAGEVPVAAVQLDPQVPVADGELERLVADSLATYKHLRHLVVVDAIPRLPSGKALRRTLRDQWTPSLLGHGVVD